MLNLETLLSELGNTELNTIDLASAKVLDVQQKHHIQGLYNNRPAIVKHPHRQMLIIPASEYGKDQNNAYCYNFDLIDLNTHQPSSKLTLKQYISKVEKLIVTKQGELAIAADGYILIWNYVNHSQYAKQKLEKGSVTGLYELPDGTLISSFLNDDLIYMWNRQSEKPIRSFGHNAKTQAGIKTLVLLENGKKAASAHQDNIIRIWDIATSNCEQYIPSAANCLQVLTTGHLATLHSGKVSLYDPHNGECISEWSIECSSYVGRAMTALANGLLSIDRDDYLDFWDPATGCRVNSIQISNSYATAKLLEFAPNNLAIVSCTNWPTSAHYAGLNIIKFDSRPINQAEVQKILVKLTYNTKVKSLSLAGIKLSTENIQTLQQIVEARQDFTTLNLEDTGISPSLQKELYSKLPLLNPPPKIVEFEPDLPPPDTLKQHPYVVELEQRLAKHEEQMQAKQQQLDILSTQLQQLAQQLAEQAQAIKQMAPLTAQVQGLAQRLIEKDSELAAISDRLAFYDTQVNLPSAKHIVERVKTAEQLDDISSLLADADPMDVRGLSLLRFSDELYEQQLVEPLIAKGFIVTIDSLFVQIEGYRESQFSVVDKQEEKQLRRLVNAIHEVLQNLAYLPDNIPAELQDRAFPKLANLLLAQQSSMELVLQNKLIAARRQAIEDYKDGEQIDADFLVELEQQLTKALQGLLSQNKLSAYDAQQLSNKDITTAEKMLAIYRSRQPAKLFGIIKLHVEKLLNELSQNVAETEVNKLQASYSQILHGLRQLNDKGKLPKSYQTWLEQEWVTELSKAEETLLRLLPISPLQKQGLFAHTTAKNDSDTVGMTNAQSPTL